MSVQLAMVGVIVTDMARSLEFYRRLGLPIPEDDDSKRFVMHRMPSGVTIFFDEVFFPGADPDRVPSPRGAYNIALEFYLGTRETVDATTAALANHGYTVRKPPWKSPGPTMSPRWRSWIAPATTSDALADPSSTMTTRGNLVTTGDIAL